MAFGNITAFYYPVAANAGTSQWGSDVRKLLSAADAGTDTTTITDHSTGGAVTRTHDPFTTATADLTQADYGFAVTPSDMDDYTVADTSGNARTGKVIGVDRPTASASGMDFDGVDRDDNSDGVNCGVTGFGVSTADGSCEWEAIVTPGRDGVLEVLGGKWTDGSSDIPNCNWVASKDSSNKFNITFVNSAGFLVAAIGTTNILSGNTYTLKGKWAGTIAQVFVANVQEGTQPALTALQAPNSTIPMTIGCTSFFSAANSPLPFQGTIKDAKFTRGGVLQGQYALTSVTAPTNRRFFPAGTWTLTTRIRNNVLVTAKAGCRLDVFLYRVAAGSGRARTLIDSWSSADFSTGAVNAFVTVTAAKSLAEIIFENDETFQVSTELSAPGTIVTGETYTFHTGTNGGVATRLDTPRLGQLLDATATITGDATVLGEAGNVLGANGTITGTATLLAEVNSVWSAAGTITGDATIAGAMSTVWSAAGTVTGDATVEGKMSSVLGAAFTIDTGGGGGTSVHPVFGHFE